MKQTKIKYDDQIRIDGKIYYKTCHRCGDVKKVLTMYYCHDCNNEAYREALIRKGKTPKPRKESCTKVERKTIRSKEVLKNEERLRVLSCLYIDLDNFINKVVKNNGWASIQDVFVTLITLYNRSIVEYNELYYRIIDTMDPKDQLEYMWNHIQKVKDALDKK